MKQIISLSASRAIDINNFTINNYNNVRRRTMSLSKANSRTALMSLSVFFKLYYEKIEYFNNLLDKKFRETIDSSQLSYNNNMEEGNQVSKVTNHENKMR